MSSLPSNNAQTAIAIRIYAPNPPCLWRDFHTTSSRYFRIWHVYCDQRYFPFHMPRQPHTYSSTRSPLPHLASGSPRLLLYNPLQPYHFHSTIFPELPARQQLLRTNRHCSSGCRNRLVSISVTAQHERLPRRVDESLELSESP
jgi:hypothetical protein